MNTPQSLNRKRLHVILVARLWSACVYPTHTHKWLMLQTRSCVDHVFIMLLVDYSAHDNESV